MIRGVRRPEEIAGLGLSHRLTARIGALLKKNTAISLAVLESARPATPLEKLLLLPGLLERGNATDGAALARLAEESGSAAAIPKLAAQDADDGFRVICLEDEAEAADGWGDAAASPPQPTRLVMPLAARDPRSGLAPLGVGGGADIQGEGVFSNAEMDRWRLKLATATSAAERIEVIRALLLAPISHGEKLDVLLQGLSDRERSVRAEAAGLLHSIGIDRDVADCLAGINHTGAERRQAAMDRLRKLVTAQMVERASVPVNDAEVGCIAACAIAALKSGDDPPLNNGFLSILAACAPAVGRNAMRLSELIRVICAMIAEAARHGPSSRQVDDALSAAHRLVRALSTSSEQGPSSERGSERGAPEGLIPALKAERERAADPVSEAFLLQHILDLVPRGNENEDELIRTAVSYLSRDVDEGRDSRAVGNRLARRGEKAIAPLCEAFKTATGGAQKYTFLLFDEMWRRGGITDVALERAAAIVLGAIETGNKGLRMAAMQSRFVCDPLISEPIREKLAESILGSIDDFAFPLDIENVEMTVARMGLPALNPLMVRLAAEQPAVQRVRSARLLGDLALNLRAPRGQMPRVQQAVDGILRRLESLSLERDFADRGELLRALGKLTASPAASKQADAVIVRTLLEAAGSGDSRVAPLALEGLTYAASSRRAAPELVSQTAALLCGLLDEMTMDVETKSIEVKGDTVIEITGGERYTTTLPILIKGMSRLAGSSNCPNPVLRDIGKLLLERWKNICIGKLVWGPGNTMLLIEALRDVASQRNFSAELRMEILKGFAPRHAQTPIMHAITEILSSADNEATAIGALTIGHVILGRRGNDGKFTAEDRSDILKALTRLAGRRTLGAQGAEAQEKALAFRRMVIEEIFKGVKDGTAGAYDLASRLRGSACVPQDLRTELERRLKEYQQIEAGKP